MPNENIKGQLDYSALNNHKRLYLPNLMLEDTCEKCKKEFSISLADHYPYDFKSDGTCSLSYLCPHCEEGVNKTLKMELTLSVVK